MSEPFISVDYWAKKSNLFIDNLYKNRQSNYKYEKEFIEVFTQYKNPIIFIKTDFIPFFVNQLLDFTNNFILITASNDDHCVPYLHFPCKDNDYKNKVDKLLNKNELIRWYTKNPAIVHDKLMGIPLGPKWQWKTTRFFGESKDEHLRIYNELCLKPEENLYNSSSKTNLLYINYAQTTTNPLYSPHKGIRHNLTNILRNKFGFSKGTNFENYMRELKTFKFCVSPPGRGIDTHRAWEALMMGTIPIMISTTQDHLFERLPVIIVDSWEQITTDFLNQKYEELIQKSYDFDILYTHYWDNMLFIDQNS
uniref:Exostosin GT47 domain-containing protein n=1 Tax=viral metagenome TaxID=1070528 RepID=A0A6C0BUT1_9ZZZZ